MLFVMLRNEKSVELILDVRICLRWIALLYWLLSSPKNAEEFRKIYANGSWYDLDSD